MKFAIQSDLKSFGYTEDGEDFIGEVYYIVAEDEQGNRFNHSYLFDGVKVHQDSEYGITYFEDVREAAKKAAGALLNKVVASGVTNFTDRPYWYRGRPAYGSLAYQAYGQYNDWLEDQMAE